MIKIEIGWERLRYDEKDWDKMRKIEKGWERLRKDAKDWRAAVRSSQVNPILVE